MAAARWGASALIGVTIVTAACATAGAAAQDDDPASSLAERYFEEGATEGSGAGRRIGYISLGEDVAFVAIVSEGIREQAAIAGAELVECDARFDADQALICGRLMADLGVEAILNYQSIVEAAGRICTAYGNLPTIAIDIHQPPCERVFMGADNGRAGLIAGQALGEHLKQERGCAYDHVWVLEAAQVGRVGFERTAGMLDGFSLVCGQVPETKLHHIDVQGTFSGTMELFTAALDGVPVGGVQIVLTINDDVARGADAAAASRGRSPELRIASQGAETTLTELACEPHWIVSTAYFPERYGHILIPAVLDLLEGEDVPQDLFIPHRAVTADTVEQIFGEMPDCAAA